LVLFWGDSHTQMLQPGLDYLARTSDIKWQMAALPACLPLSDVNGFPDDQSRARACREFNDAMVQHVWQARPAVIVLAGRWSVISYYGMPAGSSDAEQLFQGLTSLLQRLPPSISVCVTMDVPTLQFDRRYTIAMAYRKGMREPELAVSRRQVAEQLGGLEAAMRSVAASGRVTLVDLKDALCTPETCHVIVDGESMYRDSNHLSASGARHVIQSLRPCFINSGRSEH
jgi:hypothetical protein